MPTHCSATGMAFGRAGGRELVAEFDGGHVTSDAGALLLGVTDRAIRLVDRFAACFRDGRHPAFITHSSPLTKCLFSRGDGPSACSRRSELGCRYGRGERSEWPRQ